MLEAFSALFSFCFFFSQMRPLFFFSGTMRFVIEGGDRRGVGTREGRRREGGDARQQSEK